MSGVHVGGTHGLSLLGVRFSLFSCRHACRNKQAIRQELREWSLSGNLTLNLSSLVFSSAFTGEYNFEMGCFLQHSRGFFVGS